MLKHAIDPRILPSVIGFQNCSTCAHYDGDGFCTLPEDGKAITGYIREPDRVVCVQWTKREDEDA
jgi:hypothetical protein